jgi:dihydrofolate reductase
VEGIDLMNDMAMIFAVDLDWSIGYDGDMLFKIHEDLRRFRHLTEENIVVMGRKTFESLPERRALPNRINIVVTKDETYQAQDIRVVHSLEALFSLLLKLKSGEGTGMKTFLIGGGNLARQCLPYCSKAYITKVFQAFKADTLIQNLDLDPDWEVVWESNHYFQEDLEYQYVNYIRTGQGGRHA